MTIQEIHRKYFAYYDELRKAQQSADMPAEQYKAMKSVLMHDYKLEVEDYLDDQLIEFSIQRFERKFKVRMYLPRRRLVFWWNLVAKKLMKRYKAEFLTYIAALEKDTREEQQFTKQLNNDDRNPVESYVYSTDSAVENRRCP